MAVIDSGIRSSHVDLFGKVANGFDYMTNDSEPKDHDKYGHGTGMASLICGHGHGDKHSDGILGLSPGVQILPIAIDIGTTADSKEARAIRYAVDHDAKVINMSFAGPASVEGDADAISYARTHDVVLVASAGNRGSDRLEWPAAYPGVVSVGAVDADGQVWPQSNYGPQLTLTAPGVNIVAAGAHSDTEYRLSDGTSDAAAYVSAEAALVRAAFPRLTAGQVVNRMIKSAMNPTGKAHDDHYGYGIIRPDAALTFDIPAGPAAGPLPQAAVSATAAGVAPEGRQVAGVRPVGGGGGGGVVVGGVAVAVVGIVGAGVWWWRRRARGAR